MNDDHLEKFVLQNKNSFDDKEPSENVWKRIEGSLSFSNKSLWNSVMLWRAAAIIFMALSIYLLVPKNTKPQSDIALKEFSDIEAFYVKQISEKVELIDDFKRNEGLNGFTHDFQQLEAMYLVLKEEMKNRPGKKVKDALVLNLLVRIDLLNQQINKLEKEYKPKEEDKSKTNI
jgi:hypothetical protein